MLSSFWKKAYTCFITLSQMDPASKAGHTRTFSDGYESPMNVFGAKLLTAIASSKRDQSRLSLFSPI